MSTEIQLDLFEETTEFTLLERKIEVNKERTDNLRRSFFAKYGTLSKAYLEQQQQIDILKSEIRTLMKRIGEKNDTNPNLNILLWPDKMRH